jgi:hypothetical protein
MRVMPTFAAVTPGIDGWRVSTSASARPLRGDGKAGFCEGERRGERARGLETDLLQGVGEEPALELAAVFGGAFAGLEFIQSGFGAVAISSPTKVLLRSSGQPLRMACASAQGVDLKPPRAAVVRWSAAGRRRSRRNREQKS